MNSILRLLKKQEVCYFVRCLNTFIYRGNLTIKLLIIQYYTPVIHFYIYYYISRVWLHDLFIIQNSSSRFVVKCNVSQYEFNNTSITLQGVLKAVESEHFGWIQDIREYVFGRIKSFPGCMAHMLLSWPLAASHPHRRQFRGLKSCRTGLCINDAPKWSNLKLTYFLHYICSRHFYITRFFRWN